MSNELSDIEKKTISNEINSIIEEGMTIDDADDIDLLESNNLSWDELNHLKNELGKKVIEFIIQIETLIKNNDIVSNLGEHEAHFKKVVNIFFHDVNEFSKKIAKLREEHEHLSGKVQSLEEMNKYNRISIQYQYLYSELITLISPTLSSIITIANIVTNNIKEEQEKDNVQ